ncbi:hypothetical protein ABK040_006402 [Willaertia magna]
MKLDQLPPDVISLICSFFLYRNNKNFSLNKKDEQERILLSCFFLENDLETIEQIITLQEIIPIITLSQISKELRRTIHEELYTFWDNLLFSFPFQFSFSNDNNSENKFLKYFTLQNPESYSDHSFMKLFFNFESPNKVKWFIENCEKRLQNSLNILNALCNVKKMVKRLLIDFKELKELKYEKFLENNNIFNFLIDTFPNLTQLYILGNIPTINLQKINTTFKDLKMLRLNDHNLENIKPIIELHCNSLEHLFFDIEKEEITKEVLNYFLYNTKYSFDNLKSVNFSQPLSLNTLNEFNISNNIYKLNIHNYLIENNNLINNYNELRYLTIESNNYFDNNLILNNINLPNLLTLHITVNSELTLDNWNSPKLEYVNLNVLKLHITENQQPFTYLEKLFIKLAVTFSFDVNFWINLHCKLSECFLELENKYTFYNNEDVQKERIDEKKIEIKDHLNLKRLELNRFILVNISNCKNLQNIKIDNGENITINLKENYLQKLEIIIFSAQTPTIQITANQINQLVFSNVNNNYYSTTEGFTLIHCNLFKLNTLLISYKTNLILPQFTDLNNSKELLSLKHLILYSYSYLNSNTIKKLQTYFKEINKVTFHSGGLRNGSAIFEFSIPLHNSTIIANSDMNNDSNNNKFEHDEEVEMRLGLLESSFEDSNGEVTIENNYLKSLTLKTQHFYSRISKEINLNIIDCKRLTNLIIDKFANIKLDWNSLPNLKILKLKTINSLQFNDLNQMSKNYSTNLIDLEIIGAFNVSLNLKNFPNLKFISIHVVKNLELKIKEHNEIQSIFIDKILNLNAKLNLKAKRLKEFILCEIEQVTGHISVIETPVLLLKYFAPFFEKKEDKKLMQTNQEISRRNCIIC